MRGAALLVFYAARAAAFRLVVDLNTYNASEMDYAARHFRVDDGTWSITENSPGVSDAQWQAAIRGIGPNAYSEDNPGSTYDCARVRALQGGTLLAAFHYHETGGEPHTMLSWDEVGNASAACGCGVIILTRAYWPGSEWRSGVEAVLKHPKLYGVAMEFNPSDAGKRNEGDFVAAVLAAGKSPFFLLPFLSRATPAEDTIAAAIASFEAQGAAMADPRVRVVLARYDAPHLPVAGAANSVAAALARAQQLQRAAGARSTA